MKILLVFPPMLGEERYGKLARAGSYLPPLGLAYLAAVLEKKHEVKIVDGAALNITVEDIKQTLIDWKPDILGVTAYTPTFYRAVAACKMAKEIDKNILTILGGPHPSACPEDSIKDMAVDLVVVGEGEEVIIEIIAAIESKSDFSKVNGIFYKKDAKIISTPPHDRVKNLDALPFPARHLLNWDLYKPSVMHYKNLPAFSIMCGRGCPYRCTFCSCSKVFKTKVTLRTPENILEEIKFLIDKYGAKEIMFWDDSFGLYKKWMDTMCSYLKPLNITWSCWMRVNMVEPEILKKMKDSGCWHISYGIESGNQKVLDTIKKGITVEQIKNAFKWTHEAGLEARGTFILGLPNDTWETMMDTINIAIDIKADYAQFQLLTPYPGTELWDVAAQYGDFSIKDLSKYTIWFPVFIPKGLTKEQLVKAHKLAYKKFYFRTNYILQSLSNIRNLQDIKRNFMGIMSLFDFFS
ncbi:MAG: B12-binding domain-containing radical SAM protein [Elusimicrobia bacterium]|nr:B12-binding domain-containing radical SAM protein [Elusimicrobiota bacterium]MBU2614757.1 B12-binding domain-containing radical SAM protein [Elusimicrobiota bacterium]